MNDSVSPAIFDHERQSLILSLLAKNTRVRVSELSEVFGVSEATIRRDLDKLHEKGQVLRIHGGAVLADKATLEPQVFHRTNEHAEEKRRIGRAAAGLVNDGDTIFIGSGTTALEVARCLIGHASLTVITNALTVINTLAQQGGISLIATGGLMRPSELSFIGHLTDQALEQLRPQKVIMGIGGIHLEHGLTSDYLPEVSTDRLIIQSAPQVILVADHTKISRVCTAFISPLKAVHKLVTDRDIPEDVLASLRDLDIDVILS